VLHHGTNCAACNRGFSQHHEAIGPSKGRKINLAEWQYSGTEHG